MQSDASARQNHTCIHAGGYVNRCTQWISFLHAFKATLTILENLENRVKHKQYITKTRIQGQSCMFICQLWVEFPSHPWFMVHCDRFGELILWMILWRSECACCWVGMASRHELSMSRYIDTNICVALYMSLANQCTGMTQSRIISCVHRVLSLHTIALNRANCHPVVLVAQLVWPPNG